MLILWKARRKDPGLGYATTFLRQMEEVLGTCLERGIRVVANAGGLNPAGLAAKMTELSGRLGLKTRVAYLTGDDLIPVLGDLQVAGHELVNLDTGLPLAKADLPVLTANAYLGGWGITAALQAGADVVVCPRVTDASLVTGPAAWWHGWRRDDWDALAGAIAAGHVIECGPQATGGNYSFPAEITNRRYPPDSRSPRSPRTAAASSPSTTAPAVSSRWAPSPPSCSTRSATPPTSTPTSSRTSIPSGSLSRARTGSR